jgi:hypothetical protein
MMSARYVDREINTARATAALCAGVAVRARAEGRALVAGVVREFETSFRNEAELLTPASFPEVTWPPRAEWDIDSDADLDEWTRALSDSLQHSERTLRWIASRPDLPPLTRVTFDALAAAHHARRQLLLACSAIDT